MDERPGELGGGQPPREHTREEPREYSREGASNDAEQQQQQRASGRRDDRGRRGGGGGDPRRRRGGREGQPPAGQHQQHSQRPDASLNMDELRELFDLFTAQGFTEFELEKEGFRIRLRRDLSPQGAAGAQGLAAVPPAQTGQVLPFVAPQITPVSASEEQPAAATAAEKAEAAATAEAELHVITSPIVGTFYRSPSPTSDVFVRPGSHVEPDTVVCIIEAMKLMNEIQAETTGTVEKIYVENGQPVEYGQPLFGIKK